MKNKKWAQILAATMTSASAVGCSNSYVEEVRCVSTQTGKCEQLGPDAFNEGDDKYDCRRKAIEVTAGPVLTTDPRIADYKGGQSCCYLVKIDKEEWRLCASGRALNIKGKPRAANLQQGDLSWA